MPLVRKALNLAIDRQAIIYHVMQEIIDEENRNRRTAEMTVLRFLFVIRITVSFLQILLPEGKGKEWLD